MTAKEHWFKGTYISETQRAVCVRLDYDDKQHWFPKIAVEDMTQEPKQGDRIDIQLAGWLAAKEELI